MYWKGKTYRFIVFILRCVRILLFKELYIRLSRRDGNNHSQVGVCHVALLLWDDVLLSIQSKNSPIAFYVISYEPNGLIGLLGLPLLTLEASIEEVHDTRDQPGDAGCDAGDGDLDVVQVTVFIRSRKVVGAEGAEQQGQEEIQHLEANICYLQLHPSYASHLKTGFVF